MEHSRKNFIIAALSITSLVLACVLASVTFAFVLPGKGKTDSHDDHTDKIKSYTVDKKPPEENKDPHAGHDHGDMGKMGSNPHGSVKNPGHGLPADNPALDIKWTTPKHWKEQPAGNFRQGFFLVSGKEGPEAAISVVSLGGHGGGILSNVNRWRNQIGLSPIEEGDLSKHTQAILLEERELTIVDMVSEDKMIEGKYKKRMLAGVYPMEKQTWFFKAIGPDETVAAAKDDFFEFLKSIDFGGKQKTEEGS